jgi:hypothetical protein
MDAALQRSSATYRKAVALRKKYHVARAVETYALAAAEAREAADAQDSLVVPFLLAQQVHALLGSVSSETSAESKAAVLRTMVDLLLRDVWPVLRRRAAAGTLLGGACRASETEWCVSIDATPQPSENLVRQCAALFGYSTFLEGALMSFSVFNCTGVFGASPTPAESEALLTFAEEGMELVMQPRLLWRNGFVAAEAHLVSMLHMFFRTLPAGESLAAARRVIHPLAGAWARLEASGVLQERGLGGAAEAGRQVAEARVSEAAAARASFVAQGGRLRPCALDACDAVEAHASHFKLCAACKTVVYCSKAHQADDWPTHKAACKAARKAAAAAAPSGSAA